MKAASLAHGVLILGLVAAWGSYSRAETSIAPLTFEEALSQILARSTGVAAQEANLGAVRARNLPIRLAFTPSLQLNGQQTNYGGETVDSTYRDRRAEGVAQLNFFKWGADYKNWQAATNDEDQQISLLEDSYLRAQDSAIAALVTTLQRRLEIEVAEGIVKMRQDSYAIAQQRYKGGYLPLQETQKVEVDLANAGSSLADARNAEVLASAQLENLLGHSRVMSKWPWAAAFAKLTGAPAVGVNILDGYGGEALARVLGQRPDWRAAQAKVDAEVARLSRNWRLMGPSLDGAFRYGYYWSDQGPRAAGSGGGTQWAGTLSIQLPLFDRLSLYSSARAQAFTQSAAEIALEQVRRDARTDWESARKVFVTSLDTARSRDRVLEVSRKLYSDGLARFKAGRISADELLLEQSRVYTSELLAVQGWASTHLAYSRVCKARGFRIADCQLTQ